MKHLWRTVLLFVLVINAHGLELAIKKNIGPLIIVEIDKLLFLIDSGSNANFINSNSIDKFKSFIERDPSKDKFVNTFAGKTKSESYKMNLSIGDLKYDSMESYVMSTAKFSEAEDGIDCCDGILGMPFVSKYVTEIDIKNKKVLIHKNLKSVQKIKELSKLNFKLLGKDTIVLECTLGTNKQRLRLDSGSEIPFIFHRHAVEKLFLREQLFDQGFSGASLPFFKLSSIKCGSIDFKDQVATYFYAMTGALAHEGVDANVGAYILGERYIFDIKNLAIFASKKSLDFRLQKNIFSINPDYTKNIGDPSILVQAKALMVNSCAQTSKFEDCMGLVCKIEGRKICSVKNTGSVLDDFTNFYFDVKTPDCNINTTVEELRNKPVRYGFCWYKLFEINLKNQMFNIENIELPKRFVDYKDQINIYSLPDVRELTQSFYCLSVYNKIISEKDLSPALFSLSVKGVTFSRNALANYYAWLNGAEGMSCQKLVNSSLGLLVKKDLSEYFTKDYLILAAPWTILGDGADHYERNFSKVLSHEMHHVLFDLNKEQKGKTREAWNKLPESKKAEFKKLHPSYNFSDENILLREFYSYSNENISDFAVHK